MKGERKSDAEKEKNEAAREIKTKTNNVKKRQRQRV